MKRIRRRDVLPEFAQSEAQRRRKYPHTIELPGTDASLQYRMSKPYSVGELADDSRTGFVQKTELFAWFGAWKEAHWGIRVE